MARFRPDRKEARGRWARLIKKVYEVDPLVCPNRRAWKCGGKMEIIAFITESDVIRKILTHLGEYCPANRGPPARRPDPAPVPVSGEPAWRDEDDYLPAGEYT